MASSSPSCRKGFGRDYKIKIKGAIIMNIYAVNDMGELIKDNSYVGRGIVIGKSKDAKSAVFAYFIMGRSENSRNRVFIENGELLFELEERINKFKYDLFEGTFLEKIFPSPVGRTVGERYCPTIITHYHADEFFDMLPHLPIKDIQSQLWSKQRYLADVASSLQLYNPQREAAEAAKRKPMTDEQIEALANAPFLKVRSMQDILDECSGPKKTKFSRQLLWIFIISVVVSIPVGVYLHNSQHMVESQFGFSWPVVTLIFFGMWFGMSLLIALLNR